LLLQATHDHAGYETEISKALRKVRNNHSSARRAGIDALQVPKENYCQSILLYPAKLSFTTEEETKTFHDQQKLKQFMTTKPALQRYSKESYIKEKINVAMKIWEKMNLTKLVHK
jgi:hypothetical protein